MDRRELGRRDPFWDDGRAHADRTDAALRMVRLAPGPRDRRLRPDRRHVAAPAIARPRHPDLIRRVAYSVRDHTADITSRTTSIADLCCRRWHPGGNAMGPRATRNVTGPTRDSASSHSSGEPTRRGRQGPRTVASPRRAASPSAWPRRRRCARHERRPRPVGEQRPGLAERQPQRQQQRYPEGGIVPFRLALEGLEGRQPLDPHQLRLHGRRAQGLRLPRDLERDERHGQDLYRRAAAAISSMCPSLPARRAARVPVRPASRPTACPSAAPRQYSGAPRRLTIWGGTITSISRPAHAGSVERQQHRRHPRPVPLDRAAVLLAWGGHLAQSRVLGHGRRRSARRRRRWCRARRGTCGRSSSTARATRTRTAASSRAPSSASCRPRPSRRPRVRPRAAARPRRADAAPAAEPGSGGAHARPRRPSGGRADPDRAARDRPTRRAPSMRRSETGPGDPARSPS